jgi:HSP20 family molecular chaperone IbpA
MSVMRFDPFRDFDRMAEQMLGQAGRRGGALTAPMDAYRRGDRFFVHLDLPGVDPDSVELTSEQNVLTIRAERRFPTQEDDQIVVSERPQGSFTRQLFLSDASMRRRSRRPTTKACSRSSSRSPSRQSRGGSRSPLPAEVRKRSRVRRAGRSRSNHPAGGAGRDVRHPRRSAGRDFHGSPALIWKGAAGPTYTRSGRRR